jgi:hypothetical protein
MDEGVHDACHEGRERQEERGGKERVMQAWRSGDAGVL